MWNVYDNFGKTCVGLLVAVALTIAGITCYFFHPW